MKSRILAVLSICLFSFAATAANNSDVAMESLRDLQRGVRNGYVNDLSPEKQEQFKLLSDAANVLYGSSNQANYSCVAQGNGWFAVVDIDSVKKLGQNVGSLDECKKVLPAVGKDYACIAQGNGWYALYNMMKGEKLGENVGNFNECSQVVPANDTKLACVAQGNGWYAIFNLKTGVKLGQNIGNFQECQRALPAR